MTKKMIYRALIETGKDLGFFMFYILLAPIGFLFGYLGFLLGSLGFFFGVVGLFIMIVMIVFLSELEVQIYIKEHTSKKVITANDCTYEPAITYCGEKSEEKFN
jgi:uncharacterized membrane protein